MCFKLIHNFFFRTTYCGRLNFKIPHILARGFILFDTQNASIHNISLANVYLPPVFESISRIKSMQKRNALMV